MSEGGGKGERDHTLLPPFWHRHHLTLAPLNILQDYSHKHSLHCGVKKERGIKLSVASLYYQLYLDHLSYKLGNHLG